MTNIIPLHPAAPDSFPRQLEQVAQAVRTASEVFQLRGNFAYSANLYGCYLDIMSVYENYMRGLR